MEACSTMKSEKIPTVSIGIPVYNGENYLEQALQSLLAQTYTDFEIIITDNASTDRSREICQKYVALDPRVRYYQNETNLGCTGNFNIVFKYARGKYFKWAPHDDLYEPTFLEKCVEPLERDPGIVLSYARTSIIDENGKFVRNHDVKLRIDVPEPHIRFHDLLVDYLVYEIYGIIRTDAIKRTPLFGGFGHEDGVLLAHLGLMGRFHEVPAHLFLNREHSQKSWNFYKDYRAYTVWLVPSKAGKILLPRWRMGYEYVKAIGSVKLGWKESLLCYLQMGFWIKTFWKSLIANVFIAAGQIIALPFKSKKKPLAE
jgi:glycosyltransferase involved in cell wall biosynthesis